MINVDVPATTLGQKESTVMGVFTNTRDKISIEVHQGAFKGIFCIGCNKTPDMLVDLRNVLRET